MFSCFVFQLALFGPVKFADVYITYTQRFPTDALQSMQLFLSQTTIFFTSLQSQSPGVLGEGGQQCYRPV